MKLFIATTLAGGAHLNYLDSLARFAAAYDHEWTYHAEHGDGIGAARDRCVGRFMRSDCTDLLFIDSDIGFTAADVKRIMRHDVDIVGGCYPLKQDGKPVAVLSRVEGATVDKNGLQEAIAIGTGFLRFNRNVFERFKAAYPHLEYVSDAGAIEHHYFDSYVEDRTLWGEDIGFCRRWRALGGKIYADWGIALTHSGNKIFRLTPEKQTTT